MKLKNNLGFTLVELLIVIAIIGIISTLGAYSYNLARTSAKIAKAQHDIDVIRKAIETLGNDTNLWPGKQEVDKVNPTPGSEICAISDGCTYGLSDPRSGLVATDGLYENWSGPYMQAITIDPWGHEYFYDTNYLVTAAGKPCNGAGGCQNATVVGSFGPNGTGNNLFNKDDIIIITAK